MIRLGVAACVTLYAASPCLARAADQPTGLFRGFPVTYELVHGKKIFQGDIVLDHVAPLPGGSGIAPPSVGVAYGQYLWPQGSNGYAEIPYTVTSAATNLAAALTAFNQAFTGVIQFVPLGSQADYVDFNFDQTNLSGQCESSVGRVGGEQAVGGSVSCSLGTLLHEMGHVVGLYHEMSRPDRDQYLTFNTGNVIKGSEDNFAILQDNYQDLGLFDYASVMMYIPYAFTRNGGVVLETIPPGMPLSSLTGYSAGDIDGVKRLYGTVPASVMIVTNPPKLQVVVDGATVTTPQAYTWKLNSTHTLGVPAGAQSLGGNTYIYGRWNDNSAASHSIKVKPGNNTLAQPASAPANTVYTANFVQLSPYAGSVSPPGSGTLTVSPQPQTYQGTSGQFFVARQAVTLTPTPAPASGYNFIYFAGTDAPYSANPKTTNVPDGGAAFDVTAYFSTDPITTVTTTPGGFWFKVDGYNYKAPQNFTQDLFSGWGPGSQHTVTGFSPNEPYSVNTRYIFNNWSDGGAISHQFTVPSGSSTLSASYTAQYVPIVYASPDCGAAISVKPASSTGFYNAGTALKVRAAPGSGWKLTGWTGDLTGKKASQTLTVNDEELAVANYNSSALPFTVTSLSPASFAAGSAGGTVKIKGTGFSGGGSIVFVNNVYRQSTFVSSKEIDVALTSTDVTTAGAFPVGVSDFPSGAPCSAYEALGFFVTLP